MKHLQKHRGRVRSGQSSAWRLYQKKPRHRRASRLRYFRPALALARISGQRAKTDVVRPPRGVNSPRTTHHSGFTAATMRGDNVSKKARNLLLRWVQEE